MFVAEKQTPLLNGPPRHKRLKVAEAIFRNFLTYVVRVAQLAHLAIERGLLA